MTDPEHRLVQLIVDVVTLAHMVEHVVFSLDCAHQHEGGDALGHVPLSHQVRALCDEAGLDFTAICAGIREIAVDDRCPTCRGSGVVRIADSEPIGELGEFLLASGPCPSCNGTGRKVAHGG